MVKGERQHQLREQLKKTHLQEDRYARQIFAVRFRLLNMFERAFC